MISASNGVAQKGFVGNIVAATLAVLPVLVAALIISSIGLRINNYQYHRIIFSDLVNPSIVVELAKFWCRFFDYNEADELYFMCHTWIINN